MPMVSAPKAIVQHAGQPAHAAPEIDDPHARAR